MNLLNNFLCYFQNRNNPTDDIENWNLGVCTTDNEQIECIDEHISGALYVIRFIYKVYFTFKYTLPMLPTVKFFFPEFSP